MCVTTFNVEPFPRWHPSSVELCLVSSRLCSLPVFCRSLSGEEAASARVGCVGWSNTEQRCVWARACARILVLGSPAGSELHWCSLSLQVRACQCRSSSRSSSWPLTARAEAADWQGVNMTALPPPPIPAALAAPPKYSNPIFLPPASVLLLAHNLIYSARPSVAKELKWRQKRVCRRVSDRAWKKRRGVPLDRFWGNKRTVGGETLTK